MLKRLVPLLLILFLTACASPGQVDSVAIDPKGEFAEIDVAASNHEMKLLLDGDEEAIQRVLERPAHYHPGTLFALSRALFDADRQRDAAFWFYSAQLKARSDANKSLDPSARQAAGALTEQFGPPINRWAFQDLQRLRSIVESVVDADREMARNYDPRWIALSGMDAFNSETIRFEPRSRWDEINESTRQVYWEEFEQAMQSMLAP